MAIINVDTKSVKRANYAIPSQKNIIGNVKRNLALTRWKIPDDILQQRDLKIRIENILNDLNNIENIMNNIYLTTNSIMDEYTDNNQKLSLKASKFE